jgi:SlyX protein
MQDRLIELESKFSFQEDSLQELNEVLIKQQRQLDEMRQLVESLRERIAELEAGGGGGGAPAPGSERPPHY